MQPVVGWAFALVFRAEGHKVGVPFNPPAPAVFGGKGVVILLLLAPRTESSATSIVWSLHLALSLLDDNVPCIKAYKATISNMLFGIEIS
jgi:hypothetical protein